MKTYGKNFMVLMAVVLASVTSCVNDQLSEPLDDQILKTIPVLEEQLAAVEASAKDMKALNEALQSCDMEISGAVKALDSHVAALKGGMSFEKGTLATLDLQKQIAGIVGEAEASLLASGDMDNTVMRHILALEGSVRMWLGESFSFYYPVAAAHAKVNAVVTGFDAKIAKQKLYIDALASDIEAGLRKDDKPEELATLAASVKENSKNAQELSEELASKAAEMEDGYRTALKAAATSPSEFDAEALNTLNSSVEVQSVDNTLQGLISRVAACESQLEDILTRLGALESTVTDLNKLLEMIQSLTFMSEYSEDKAVAYYSLNKDGAADAQGRKPRTPEGTIDFKYVVRPASAAAALTSEEFWNSNFKIFGYYAQSMTKATGDFFDFTITNVVADQLTGVATITVENALSANFFFKETGAKVALSVATGKTDLTSKFVEIVPKDNSGTVYVETLELSAKSIEVDNGSKADIDAYVTPDNATEGGVIWTTSDPNVLTVTENGVVEGKAVGNAVITATTKGIDEWGNAIVAQCSVKVNPAIKLSGPSYVEEKGNITIRIESPDYIDPESVTWTSSAPTLAVITKTDDGNAVIKGDAMYYDMTGKTYTPIIITCDIEGKATLSHEIRVIAVQPLGISINGLSDADTEIYTKQGAGIDLTATIKPAEVNSEYFKVSGLATGYVAFEGYFAASEIGVADVSYSIQPGGTGQYNYFYPKGKSISRNITVVVEPCYVESISLPATHDMLLDQTATLTPTMTSDVEGKDPTYPDLIWTSSAPEIVSINETTGEMTALKEGSATVTATTSHADAVPSGQAQKSASCVVTVKKPTAPIAIGDYYYSDGTWSTERDNSKTVVGIVFSKVGATTTDTKLAADHPQCYNGLVVSLEEASTAWQSSAQNVSSWVTTNLSYGDLRNYDKTNGYSNTIALKAYNEQNSASKVLAVDGTAPSAGAPGLSSGWYLPSYKELSLLAESYATIKDKLASVGTALDATTPNYNIGSGGSADTYRYWASTESSSSSSWGCCVQFSNCSMMSNQSKNKTHYRVRYILAF